MTANGLDACLRKVAWRLRLREALSASTFGLLSAAAVALAILGGRGSARLALLAAIASAILVTAVHLFVVRERWASLAAARAVEHARPDSRNLIITARELMNAPDRGQPWMRARVFADAQRIVDATDARAVVPIGAHAAKLAGATLVFAAIAVSGRSATVQRVAADLARQAGVTSPAPAALRIAATIVPPRYIKSAPVSRVDPERLDAVQGSHVRLEIRPAVGNTRVRFGSKPLALTAEGDRLFAEMVLGESGYFAIEGDAAVRRLLPVVVTPDRAPVIRVEAPGKDLLLPDAKPVIAVTASAADDYGLAALDLRYTKVSGSGEQFDFEEGVIPLEVRRDDPRAWKAQGSIALSRLGLQPGDSLVYRVVGRDARPGEAGLASSDTFFVEIAGPGQVALAGFELPPDRERYALSQQMIVLKIQRLRARERAMARPDLVTETGDIAAEQRAVRANFVFLLGGHVEDEVEEAEQSHEIQEGRLENTARREIDRAIGHMSLAERALVAVETATALTEAKAAVMALQRAFGQNRYILRAMPVRSRLDPSRRLSGELQAASDWDRDPARADPDARAESARALFAQVLTTAPSFLTPGAPKDDAAVVGMTRLAEEALRVDPASKEWQTISQRLSRVRDAITSRKPESEVAALLHQAIDAIASETRRLAVNPSGEPLPNPRLRGAWTDAQRRQ